MKHKKVLPVLTVVLTLLTTALTAGCAPQITPQIETIEVEVTTTPTPKPTSAPEPSVAPISLVDSGQRLGAARSWDVSLGDLDGDGDLDAFMAGSPNQVWLNDGAGTFTDSGPELSSRAGDSVALGNLDGDGDLDAFVVHGELGRDSGGGIPNEVWLNETP